MTRDELQERAVGWLEENRRLILQWATGTGKSGVVMKFLLKHPGMRVLILVPETNNIQNWENEFEKFGVPIFGVQIACYASLHKFRDESFGLLVLDEAPHTNTEMKSDILSTITADYILALGAVISQEERMTLDASFDCRFEVHTIGLDRAIELGILPEPSVHVIHMNLDNREMRYMMNGKKMTELSAYKNINDEVSSSVQAYNLRPTYANKQRMLRAGSKRKQFLGKVKQDAIHRLCTMLDDRNRRYLCFCVSVKQAESIGGDRAFTSKTPVSMNLLDRFNSGEVNSLFVVGKLIEGQNLKDIHCGVIGQVGASNRITVQEIGRIMRSEKPVVYVPVIDGTKDMSFLRTITDNIPSKYIKHYSL